jgi:hypothetical protein
MVGDPAVESNVAVSVTLVLPLAVKEELLGVHPVHGMIEADWLVANAAAGRAAHAATAAATRTTARRRVLMDTGQTPRNLPA